MKILIIRFSSIGDIVLTTPVVRCLRQQLGAEIHFLTKQNFKPVLENNPYITRLWTIEKNVFEILPDLKQENFDAVVDLHKNLRSWQVKWVLSTKNFVFHKLNMEKWLMVNFKINVLPPLHIVDRYLKAVEPLGIKNDGQGLDYFIPEKDAVDMSSWEFPESNVQFPISTERPITNNSITNHQFIAFVIGAAHATKRLPPEKIVFICDKAPLPVMLLGGKEDAERGQMIESQSIGKVLNLCGKLNLNQSASVVRQAHTVISHDTGLMHIAAAFRKNIISIWGNTIPAFGMSPYQDTEESKIFEISNLSCRPCSKIGFDKCPKGHFRCMNLQDTEGVVAAIKI